MKKQEQQLVFAFLLKLPNPKIKFLFLYNFKFLFYTEEIKKNIRASLLRLMVKLNSNNCYSYFAPTSETEEIVSPIPTSVIGLSINIVGTAIKSNLLCE